MLSAVFDKGKESAISENQVEMALLPGLCCWAAGGEAQWADHIAAAWLLFYAAADIMDSIQDQDEPAPWWGDLGPAAALSAATGLFFSAASLLQHNSTKAATRDVAPQLIQGFYLGLTTMSSGQYADVRNPGPTIEAYWEIAAQKSGAFFATACRSGAMLATNDASRIEHFALFGHHLGQLIQVRDDLEDFTFLKHPSSDMRLSKLNRSLPVVYTMQMVPLATKERLQFWLGDMARDPKAIENAVGIIEDSGAVIYLNCEIEKNKQLAIDHLNQADPLLPARELLIAYLEPGGSTS